MDWHLSNDKPIYLQLIDQIKRQILAGRYDAGSSFPSVRELAADAAVNPNTMQRTLAALEQQGLLVGSRTNGRTVTSDASLLSCMREELARDAYLQFFHALTELGFSREEMHTFLQSELHKEEL